MSMSYIILGDRHPIFVRHDSFSTHFLLRPVFLTLYRYACTISRSFWKQGVTPNESCEIAKMWRIFNLYSTLSTLALLLIGEEKREIL